MNLDAHTEKILSVIRYTKAALQLKIDAMALNIGVLRADHKKMAKRMAEMKSTLANSVRGTRQTTNPAEG